MTDELAPGGPSLPEAPSSPSLPTSPQPAGAQPPMGVGGAAGRRGGRGAVVIIGVIVVFLAIVLFAVRNSVSADDLKVGDCFDIPTGDTAQTVEHHGCTESHTGEVFQVAEYSGDGTTYPISLTLESFVQDTCGPAFEAYTGRSLESATELAVGYFYPSRDGWSAGDRTFTCYIAREDDGVMTESVKR